MRLTARAVGSPECALCSNQSQGYGRAYGTPTLRLHPQTTVRTSGVDGMGILALCYIESEGGMTWVSSSYGSSPALRRRLLHRGGIRRGPTYSL